jgi:hypothetical protein
MPEHDDENSRPWPWWTFFPRIDGTELSNIWWPNCDPGRQPQAARPLGLDWLWRDLEATAEEHFERYVDILLAKRGR